ncbi:sensor domain-containing protein [Paraglaciecola sp.]|uniref:sensor domain-containing protein n=1 Tax=Paraglaciecola sp. TaxID=1920173 RepID=UPI003EF7ACF2
MSDHEIQKRKALANVVASQTSTSLEVFSADRKRALENLVLSWPARHPNPVDWFHTHASDIKNIMPGIRDVWWVNPDFTIRWSLSLNHKDRLLNSHLGQYGIDVEHLSSHGLATSLYSSYGLATLYALKVDPNNHSLGYVVASFDVKTTLEVLIGELVGPEFNFLLRDQDTQLLTHGNLIEDLTLVKVSLNFADRNWQLWLQSPAQAVPMSRLIFWLGCLMSFLVCLFFYWQLSHAIQSSKSQAHYKAASEAALDSILIFECVCDSKQGICDFRLVDANKLALKRIHLDLKKPANLLLTEHLKILQVPHLFEQFKQVSQSGRPFEHTLNNSSALFDGQWMRLQVVKADSGLAMTVRDISLRYESQLKLKNSEARFRRLVDGLNRDFVYSLSPDNRYQFVSTSVSNILGYKPDEFIANANSYLLTVPDNIRQIRQRQSKGLKTPSYVQTLLSADNKEISIECNDSPVFDENGKLVAIEGIARDVTEDLILKQKIYYQANHDPLTGLYNRYAFDIKLKDMITNIPEEHTTASLCYIDMDKFKIINDTCGHQAGDQLLKGIANLLQQNIGKRDVLARVGGDEFCLLLLEQTQIEVKRSVQKLLDSVSAFRFEWQGRVFHIGASVGIVQMDKANLNAVDVIKAADSACYLAKYNGRNQYIFHDNTESGIEFRNTELKMLGQVQTALDQNNFELYFQTIKPLDIAANQKIRYEILLRMYDEHGKVISPGVFIPIAERHGLMSRVDEWVFTHTLALLESYPEHVKDLDKCAINLSGASINSPSLMKKLLNTLQRTNVPKDKLCFEITETSAVTNLVKAANVIEDIRNLGCKFALDDFGAGMSSFTYLKNMKVDYVKIDGSFVKNMCNDVCDFATVKAIHEIAHSMGKQTIAEFVGDIETEQKLQQLGVNFAQGYGISAPTPFADYLLSYGVEAVAS